MKKAVFDIAAGERLRAAATQEIIIKIEVKGKDAAHARAIIDRYLDGGDLQDTVNGRAADDELDLKVVSAVVL